MALRHTGFTTKFLKCQNLKKFHVKSRNFSEKCTWKANDGMARGFLSPGEVRTNLPTFWMAQGGRGKARGAHYWKVNFRVQKLFLGALSQKGSKTLPLMGNALSPTPPPWVWRGHTPPRVAKL